MALSRYIKQPLSLSNLAQYVDRELRKIELAFANIETGGGGATSIVTRKTAQTSRNSLTTLTVDTDFTTTIDVGLWETELFLLWKSADAANGGFAMSLAFTGTMDPAPVDNNIGNRFVALAPVLGAANAIHTDPPPVASYQQLYSSGFDNDNLLIWSKGVFRVSVSGDFKLYWAQLVSKVTPTIVLKDSFVRFTKVAD